MTEHFAAFPAADDGDDGPDGGAPERAIARDLAIRTVLASPVMLAVGAGFWGWSGFFSAGHALVIVAVNFILGAAAITWGARISPAAMFGAIMFGFVVRLGIITGAVLPFRAAEWFEIVPFAISLLVTHLGLLAWETRHVSASLAFPGLKPGHVLLTTTDPAAERSA